jgi:alpha-D-ribose 1-methylphosphonate 5-phosphate C-P lyase
MTIYVTILEKTRFLESNTIYEQHKLYNLDKYMNMYVTILEKKNAFLQVMQSTSNINYTTLINTWTYMKPS